MLISYSDNAVRIVHMDYPTVAIAVIDGHAKKVKLSVGIGLKNFDANKYADNHNYTEYMFGPRVAEVIKYICQHVTDGKECNRELVSKMLHKVEND